MSEHIAPEQSLALVALEHEDPERMRAFAHAQACAECRALLREGEAMLRMLDALADEPALAPALKEKTRAGLTAPAPTKKRPWRAVAIAALLLVSIVFALFEAHGEGLSAATGLHCMMFEQLVALGPLVITGALALRGVIAREPLNLALATTAGALVGELALHYRCPAVPSSAHLFVFHVGGVLLAALLGLIGGRAMASRAAR